MVKNVLGRANPIKNITAKLSMIGFAVILGFTGFFLSDILVSLGERVITQYFVLILAVFTTFLVMVELGLKKFTRLSSLKRFTNQQVVTVVVALAVLLGAVLWTFFPSVEGLTFFVSGSFVVQSLTIILEAFR